MMKHQRIHKPSSWAPPTQAKDSQFASRPFTVQTQQDSDEEYENDAFEQNKFEAFGLQLKEKYGTITPVEQERLGVLQAKMNEQWAPIIQRALQPRPYLLPMSVHAPDQHASAAVQPPLTIQPFRAGVPAQAPQPAFAPPRNERINFVQRAFLGGINQSNPVPPIQAKLTIGPPNDEYEQEANLEKKELLQGQFATDMMPTQLETPSASDKNHTGMPDQLKTGLEQLSGFDMSGVRVHYNSAKPAQLNALAYAQGQNIEVGPGQERHLPHEGWHVVQQMQGRVQPTMQAKGVSINDDAGLEREADVMGVKAVQTRNDQVATSSMSPMSTSFQRRKRAASPFPLPDLDARPPKRRVALPASAELAGAQLASGVLTHRSVADLQRFAGKRTTQSIIGANRVIQRKPVCFESATQKEQEGNTHYGKTVHFLTRHGPGVTDASQKARLLGQQTAFENARQKKINDIDEEVARAKAGAKKSEKKAAKVKNRIAEFADLKKQLLAIQPGSPDMFIEFGSSRRVLYKEFLKKSPFGAGTPTRVVTNFAEEESMLSMAGEMVKLHHDAMAAVVGEAGAAREEKEGKLTKETRLNVAYKKHTLTSPNTVQVEDVTEVVNVSMTFVAEENPADGPGGIEDRAGPIVMLVESGYTRPE